MGLFRRTQHTTAEDTIRAEHTAKARKADAAREANARIDAALDSMHSTSIEIGQRRAELRAKCPLSNHDRCRSH